MDWSSDVCSSDLLVPSDAAALIQDQLVNVAATAASKAGLGLAIALFFSIYGATRASGAIITALGVIYEEEDRSEERRVGQECVSTCRSRWSPDSEKTKNTIAT